MRLKNNRILLKRIETTRDSLEYHYETRGMMSRFLAEGPMIVRCEGPLEDITPAIAAIPFVGLTAPMAWFFGGTLEVPALDARYAGDLEKVKEGYQAMHPDVCLSGHVDVGDKVTTPPHGSGNTAMLFSGGIDSSATMLRHLKEDPILISLRGADVRLHDTETWHRINSEQAATAALYGLRRTVVESNYYELVQQWALDIFFPGKLCRGWYTEIAYGQIFVGLCAPLTWRDGVDTIYLASSFTAEFDPPDGSHPSLDGETAWSDTRVIHDGFHESRQEKVERLASAFREGAQAMTFQICPSVNSEGTCEKCSRTMTALATTGLDPARHGFHVSSDTPARIRRALEKDLWKLPYATFWRDIQRRIPQKRDAIPGEWRDLIDWLDGADLESMVIEKRPSLLGNLRRKIKQTLPFPVFAAIRRWKRRLLGLPMAY
jgi:hypothetical protein